MNTIPTRRTYLTKKAFAPLGLDTDQSPESTLALINQISKENQWGAWRNTTMISNIDGQIIIFKHMNTPEQKHLFLKEYLQDGFLFLIKRSRLKLSTGEKKAALSWLFEKSLNERLKPKTQQSYSIPYDMKGFINDFCLYARTQKKKHGVNCTQILEFESFRDFSQHIQMLRKEECKRIFPKSPSNTGKKAAILPNGRRIFPKLGINEVYQAKPIAEPQRRPSTNVTPVFLQPQL